MILALVLFSIALAAQPSLSYPLGIWADPAQVLDISTNFDSYYGPWNYGNRFWSSYGGYGGLGDISRGLYADGYADPLDYDYGYYPARPFDSTSLLGQYGNPVRTVDVGRDRVVRDFSVTEIDNWIRDQTTFRAPTRFRSYGPLPARRVYASGFGAPRTSSLKSGGDMLFMRR